MLGTRSDRSLGLFLGSFSLRVTFLGLLLFVFGPVLGRNELTDLDIELDHAVLRVLNGFPVELVGVSSIDVGHGECALTLLVASKAPVVSIGALADFLISRRLRNFVTESLLLFFAFSLLVALGLLIGAWGRGQFVDLLNGHDLLAARLLMENPLEALLALVLGSQVSRGADVDAEVLLGEASKGALVVQIDDLGRRSHLLLSLFLVATSEHEVKNDTDNKDAGDDHD